MKGPLLASLAVLALLTLGELRLFDRLLFEGNPASDFVLVSVNGILEGRPISKSWQHRLLGPAAVAGLGLVTADRARALVLFSGAMVVGANLLLFGLIRRKGGSYGQAVVGVALFGFAHALLMYRLEYPWDGVDILLFLAFGYWASKGGGLLRFSPLLVLGLVNHETVLYIPLWYLLSPVLTARSTPHWKRELLFAGIASVAIGGGILLLRQRLYIGRPDLPGQVFEQSIPFINNHFELPHNLRQLFFADWVSGRAFISAGLTSAVALLVVRALKGIDARAAVWTLCVLATIVCFGYVNETRHYLSLVAFWFAYAWPVHPTAGVAAREAHALI